MNLNYRIHQQTQVVFNFLSDMQKFVTVHPVIYKIEDIGNGNYLVYETLTFCRIPFSFKYYARVEKNEPEYSVILKATVFKVTHIEMKFDLVPDNDYTIVKEQVKFKTILPVVFLLKRIFRKQHQLLFNNIECIKQ